MANGELTYDDFLQRLDIQDVLVDAGYHLNKRDGLRYPSYIRTDSNGTRIRGDKFIVTGGGKCCFQPPQQSSTTSSPLSSRSPKSLRNTETACLPTGWSTLSVTDC